MIRDAKHTSKKISQLYAHDTTRLKVALVIKSGWTFAKEKELNTLFEKAFGECHETMIADWQCGIIGRGLERIGVKKKRSGQSPDRRHEPRYTNLVI